MTSPRINWVKNRRQKNPYVSNGISAKTRAKLVDLAGLVENRDFGAVVTSARALLQALPEDSFVLKALGFGLVGQAEFDLALPILRTAIRLSPRDPELYNNLGICLSRLMRSDEALQAFDQALANDGSDAEIWKNKGVAFAQLNRWNDAIDCFAKAVELFPGDYDEAIDQLAAALLNAGRNEEAFACYTELVASEPDNPHYIGGYLRASLRQCKWDGLHTQLGILRELTACFERPAIAPFDALAIPGITADEQKCITEVHLRACVPSKVFSQPPLARKGEGRRNGRLRIGYVSYDIKNHPVAYVIPQVLELHDRTRFEVIGYSTGPDDRSEIRERLKRAFDSFVDISDLGITSSAERIRDDDIDVLIDLQGWTLGDRAGMFALRPARIQVGWLGYAGTVGSARLADYLIGDSVVIPPEHEAYYAETVQRLPHCYLPMDATQEIGPAPSRREVGLPEDAFVYCSPNNCYKFNPVVFDAWCRLLLETPSSCLWLNRPFGQGAENLLREATSRGVEPDRIIFSNYAKSRAEYLARLQLADLALDPSPYNSHSSGMDLLWAGVPMVSLLGDTFQGRVGASLLKSAGLPECIAGTWEEYIQLAIRLYSDSNEYLALRKRLADSKKSAPLFDMPKFTKDLEAIFEKAVDTKAVS